jgi:hypothetical protein
VSFKQVRQDMPGQRPVAQLRIGRLGLPNLAVVDQVAPLRGTGSGAPPRRDYRTRSKAPRTMASNPVGVDGGSAAAGSLSIATITKVWPLLLVAR